MKDKYVEIEEPGVKVTLGPFEWFIKPRGGFEVGRLKDGSLIVVARFDVVHVWKHVSFKEMAEGDGSADYDSSVLRAVAHKLGITTYEGHDVDTFFPDETIEESLATQSTPQ